MVSSIYAAVTQALEPLGDRAGMWWPRASPASARVALLGLPRRPARFPPCSAGRIRRATSGVGSSSRRRRNVHRKTGLFLSAHYGASKLRWAHDNLPAVREALAAATLCWGPQASFLVYRLTAEQSMLADPQCAARTQLWNIHTRDWDTGLLSLFGLPQGHLPRCVPTCHRYGTMRVGDTTVPLVAVNGDQSAAVFAFGWPEEDSAYVNIGTSAFMQRAVTTRPGLCAEKSHRDHPRRRARPRSIRSRGNVNGAGTAARVLMAELGIETWSRGCQLAGGAGRAAAVPQWHRGTGRSVLEAGLRLALCGGGRAVAESGGGGREHGLPAAGQFRRDREIRAAR